MNLLNFYQKRLFVCIFYSVLGYLVIGYFCTSRAQSNDYVEGCPFAKFTVDQHQNVYLLQHKFDDGTRDLVMSPEIQAQAADMKRVTFNNDNTQTCPYAALAIDKGQNSQEHWGWHLAWADAQKIYYARMDGTAWVSSVPKKIVAEHPSTLHFSQLDNQLTLSWQISGDVFIMRSEDEGRSWQPPNMITGQQNNTLKND